MTALVLLPGMMCDARLFGPQIAALSGTHAIHCAPVGGHATVHALAAEVLAHAPPRFALAGLSMGGIVAMEALRQAPERIDRIALMDTNPLAETAEVRARRAPQIEAVQAGGLRRVMRDEMKPNYLANGPGRQATLDLCMEMAEDLGPDVFVRQSRALRDRPDQTETLRGFRGAALILCGRHDVPCPVSRHELMHELMPGSRLQIVEEAGHLTTLEAPDAVTAILKEWLET
ncbi:MAG: alpha/beta hydrolase [Paracoccaceae bacterium]|jgi:pimeloyl-ACP methyl ester carboxylesterase|nr:alpha/beta hydrolase [Paracoccaceae bacterium]